MYILASPVLWNLHVILDVSGIIEKFNVYATLAIIPRTKEINRALWLVHAFIKTLNFKLLGRSFSLLHDFLPEEFGSSTISQLFRKRILSICLYVLCNWLTFQKLHMKKYYSSVTWNIKLHVTAFYNDKIYTFNAMLMFFVLPPPTHTCIWPNSPRGQQSKDTFHKVMGLLYHNNGLMDQRPISTHTHLHYFSIQKLLIQCMDFVDTKDM